MARPREFDKDCALDSAIAVFSEHGFEGSSAQMLVDAMGIGRQSLYAAFGDKWTLYCAAVRKYGSVECAAHIRALESASSAIDGIKAMLYRVVATAGEPCLGVGSSYEFGTSRKELVEINSQFGRDLRARVAERVQDAQRGGHITSEIEPVAAAEFIIANIAAVRFSGRSGSDTATLVNLAELALRALK